MSLKHALLGFLSWRPMTGYDLKRIFANSVAFHWSGNNNQIYTTLTGLHRAGLVSRETQKQATRPDKKIYSVTPEGVNELHRWLKTEPELPELRHPFLVQLQWADALGDAELLELISSYEHQLRLRLLLYEGEKARLDATAPVRTPRERYLSAMLLSNLSGFYEHELAWVSDLRRGLDCRW